MAEGFGAKRFDVMYNDFILVGPQSDPAGIKGTRDIAAAFRRIAETKATFVSRGDNSGTHIAELNLWEVANVNLSEPKGAWYREIGQGMGLR